MANVDYKTIVTKAKTLKTNVEKNKKLGINQRWSYYIANAILTPNKDIPKNKDMSTEKGNATNPRGDAFNSVKIYKNDYLDVAKRIVAYVKKNHKLPDYATWNNKKISVKDYAYNLSKILVYYSTHNKTYPVYNTINTNVWKKDTIKKYGHATKPCADNRGQNNGYYCGCHSLQEIFRNLTGIVVPQSTIASWCGTTTDGTDHDGLNTGVALFNRKYGKNLTVKWYNFSELGWDGLRKIIASNNKDFLNHVLYRGTWGHYEVINKIYDDYCDVQNSLGDYCDYDCYCGYVEERYLSTHRRYIGGISQKSVMVVTNES